MKKIIILCITAAALLSGCNLKEVTRIFPVEDFMVVGDGVIATFELDGIKNKFEFGEDYIYPCEYSSRIIAEGVENDNGFRSYDLYLYLSKEDYTQYLYQMHGLEDYEAQKENLKQQITNLQVELNELERMAEQEEKKMKVLIVQPKSLMVEVNPEELRKKIIEEIKDGRVVLLPTTVMYEVVEIDGVEIPKSGEKYGST